MSSRETGEEKATPTACPACGNECIQTGFSHCPICGARIKDKRIEAKWASLDDIVPGEVIDGNYTLLDGDRRGNKRWYLAKNADGRLLQIAAMDGTFHGFTRYEYELLVNFDHPCIPKVYEILRSGDIMLAVMEIYDVDDISWVMKRKGGKLAEDEAVAVVKQICDAVGYMHAIGYLHRDLSPRAISLRDDGRLVLWSFWTTCKIGSASDLGCWGADRGFAPIEAYRKGLSPSFCSEIYSIGALLFYMVTGRKPTEFLDQSTLPSIRMINPALSEGLEYVIAKATRMMASDRYQSCDEMLQDLERIDRLSPRHGLLGMMGKPKFR